MRLPPDFRSPGSAAPRGAAAVEALVARSVANHDRAAVGAGRGVGLGGKRDLRAAEIERDSATVLGLRGVAIRVPIGVPVRSADGSQVTQLDLLHPRSGLSCWSNVLRSGEI